MRYISVKRYILSFLASYALTLVILGIFSLILSFSRHPLWLPGILCSYSGYFSAFIAALLCTSGIKKNGLITGVICSDIYMMLLILAGTIFFKSTVAFSSLPGILMISSVLGAIGGIIGVNVSRTGH